MADYTGHGPSSFAFTIGSLRPDFLEQPTEFHTVRGFLTGNSGFGTFASTQPVDEVENTYVGHGGFEAGFGGIFYNRIEIQPIVVDFGNLITLQQRKVSLWNGFLVDKPLDDVAVDASGVTVDEPIAIPGTLRALEVVEYTLTGGLQGDAVIDGTLSFEIDGILYSIAVIGRRIIVFPFTPNWGNEPIEELTWMTNVERAYAGDEQRREMRRVPRVKWQFDILAKNRHDSAILENLMFGWQARNFSVPIPTSKTTLTQNVSLGESLIMMNTVDRGFYPGQAGVILVGSQRYESVVIDTVLSDHITLADPILNNWDKGAAFYATGAAHLLNQQALRRETDFHMTGRFEWLFEVNEAVANLPIEAAALTYRTHEVWLRKFNWSQRPTFTYDDKFDTFGADGVGILEFDSTSDWPATLRQHLWLMKSRAEELVFRKFLKRRSGRLAPFWIPTWNSDFIPVSGGTNTAAIITVKDNGYHIFGQLHEVRRDVAVFLRGNDTPMLRRIASTVDNLDGTTNLVMDANWGVTFTADQVKRICFLNLVRLASDAVSITHKTDEVGQMLLNLITVKG